MAHELDRREERWTDRLPGALVMLAVTLVVLWGLEIVDLAMNGRLDAYGIRPRSVSGLEGIPFAPFLHAGFGHLLSNTVGFAVLGVVTYAAVTLTRFIAVIVLTAMSSGLGAWLFGSSGTVVVGASGVIFGLLGFLLLRGLAERSPGAITVSIMMLLVYGGTISGILPGAPFVSWQSHLFGFLGGVVAAFMLRPERRGRGRSPGPARG